MIKLDRSKLLGFRLESAAQTTGAKLGNTKSKPSQRLGAKLGTTKSTPS